MVAWSNTVVKEVLSGEALEPPGQCIDFDHLWILGTQLLHMEIKTQHTFHMKEGSIFSQFLTLFTH